jgi:hypothetical protein
LQPDFQAFGRRHAPVKLAVGRVFFLETPEAAGDPFHVTILPRGETYSR